MAELLYLVHRMPYPPNKGDKVRSFHLLEHLARQHRVYLGTFMDDPEDAQHLQALERYCAGMYVEKLDPRLARIRSLTGLLRNEALSLAYYRSVSMAAWVEQIARQHSFDASIVFSSVMAMYSPKNVPMLVDLVDVDSAKWTQYSSKHRWPMSWVYRREGTQLLEFERATVRRARRSFLVTPREVELFETLAPECKGQVDALCNGVDAAYFDPAIGSNCPFADGEVPLVFTGAMDYWPNIDAAIWFSKDILPRLLPTHPKLRFYVVGRSPSSEVKALASPHVVVTGTVPDVRPYLQGARIVVAPLRVARGVQNKILEAMAMARPVLTSTACKQAIVTSGAPSGLYEADTEADYVAGIERLLADPQRAQSDGRLARELVLAQYSWRAHLAGLDRHLTAICPQ